MTYLLKIFYAVFLFFYLFACFAIVFHLYSYSLHKKTTFLTILIFIIGAIIFIALNAFFAFQIDWSSLGAGNIFGNSGSITY